MAGSTRRDLLAATALFTAFAGNALGRTVSKALPWQPNEAYPAARVQPGPWLYLTVAEATTIDAIVDRLIPPDDLGAGGKDAGCTVFIDRQLAGPFGGHDWLYMQGPFPADPLPSQGLQSPLTPRQQYRLGLAALGVYCQANFAGRQFAGLTVDEQDKLLAGLEKGEVKLTGFDGRMLFGAIYANTMEGYFADPIYGGNAGMVGWKLVGFPGTRYDYRDVIANPNKAYTLPPVGLAGRPAWGQPT
jgi:gluconate 2-dehydrogenase gamma chain